ncbi:hypothetical protein A5712_05160 [Mycobacterium sp. E2327]|nr:hypothetical protein A5712_05160 [Mycobacterium sp. E2327]
MAAFGSALVGLDADKRLGLEGEPVPTTQQFELLGDEGTSELFALPADVYVLAAMNEADTSVEPLDVAFLRRFAPYRLEPQPTVLRAHLGLPGSQAALKDKPENSLDVYEALVQGWEVLNKAILLARGGAYQLGHGALMHRAASQSSMAAAKEYALEAWATIRGHLDEVFFGDTRAMIDILRAEDVASPYSVEESVFAGQSVSRIVGPNRLDGEQLYRLLFLIVDS